tara:strand:- start:1208 stop:1525 length:318 start_codon:yes stop_codon:yes gene_type:complete
MIFKNYPLDIYKMTTIYIERGTKNDDFQLHLVKRLNSTVFYEFSDKEQMMRYYKYLRTLKGKVYMPFIRKVISNNVDLIKSIDSGILDDHGSYYPNAMKKIRIGI